MGVCVFIAFVYEGVHVGVCVRLALVCVYLVFMCVGVCVYLVFMCVGVCVPCV